MLLKALAWSAVAFGVLAGISAVMLAPSTALPFVALIGTCAVLLVSAGVAVLRGGAAASFWLTAAWGFAFATSYGVFFSQNGEALQRGAFDAQEAQRAIVLGAVALVSLKCFALTLLFGARGGRISGA